MDSSASSNASLLGTEPQIEHIIDIPRKISPAPYDACCIYKVPPHLKKVNDGEAYTPQLISIGPFHYDTPQLKPMHTQKQRYFHAFWERLENKQALAKYKAYLKNNIDMIRQCYWELDADCPTDDEFVDMILLDSVFILELFLRNSEESVRETDYMFSTLWIHKTIPRDLLLLENQLPIFVLEKLHKTVYKDNNSLSFLALAYSYFEDYNPQKSKYEHQNEMMIKNCKSCKHFTDLLRWFYLPKEVKARGWMPQTHFTRSDKYKSILKTAAKLNEAGVSFESVHNKSLLEIKFEKAPVLSLLLCFGCLPGFKIVETRLQIPQFKVHQRTDCVMRNLIALEQCHYPSQPFICNYVYLLHSLINTQEDVELLVEKDIIVHELVNHEELAIMINGLCENVVVTSNYYGKISEKLNDHYYNNWNYYMGMLRSVYFRNLWRVSSTIVGIVVFLFSVVSFLRDVGLYHPKD